VYKRQILLSQKLQILRVQPMLRHVRMEVVRGAAAQNRTRPLPKSQLRELF